MRTLLIFGLPSHFFDPRPFRAIRAEVVLRLALLCLAAATFGAGAGVIGYSVAWVLNQQGRQLAERFGLRAGS